MRRQRQRDGERQRCLETETRNRDTKRWRYLEIEAEQTAGATKTGETHCISRPGSVPAASHTSRLGVSTDEWTDRQLDRWWQEHWDPRVGLSLSAHSSPPSLIQLGCGSECGAVHMLHHACCWPGDGWLCWRRACTSVSLHDGECAHTRSLVLVCVTVLSCPLCVTGLAVLLGVPGCVCVCVCVHASMLALCQCALCSFVSLSS